VQVGRQGFLENGRIDVVVVNFDALPSESNDVSDS
jgi:hypothetical protein